MGRILLLLAVCGVMQSTLGFPSGAPSSSCVTMLPDHYYRGRDAQAQRVSSPYNVIFDSDSGSYRPGERIDVKIVTDTRARMSFRGFIMQARAVNGEIIGPVGRWVMDEDDDVGKIKTTCSSDGALTHRRSRPVYSAEGHWVAPTVPVGDIVFVASVVRSYQMFWVNITSPILSQYRPPTTPTATTSSWMNSTGNCVEGELEELTAERPGLAILCYEDTHCPCGWVCCSQCASSATSLCRKPRDLHSSEENLSAED